MASADDLLADLERRLADVEAPRKVEPLRKDTAPPPAKSPPGWRFVPVRDSDNLIIEIIARPLNG